MAEGEVSTEGELVKPFTVHVYEGSDLTSEVVEKLKLRDLLALDIPDDTDKIENVLESYRQLHNALYVAQSPSTESAIGVMQVDRWARGTEWGDAYWGEVDYLNPQLGKDVLAAIVLSNARTHPDWQRQGVQKNLLKEILERENPGVILGESRNPAAVMSRATTTAEGGYKTFFDMVDVSPNASEDTIDEAVSNKSIACTFPFVLLAEETFGPIIEEEGLLVAHPIQSISHDTPSIVEFPPSVQNAFGHLLEVQQRKDRDTEQPPVSVIAPLVSIRSDLLSEK